MGLLGTIERPADLKALSVVQLQALAQEIREEILRTVSELGGHLASSLGAVELCLALHVVFDAPEDQLIWDMGYQAFAHKLVTGRRERFKTLKQLGGLSGFSHKDESPYDVFTTGHGGTALSTALGLALAQDQVRATRQVVAIIGDASLGEGMALEALNHIGHVKPNLLVILNDNKMSISKPVGGLSRYLNRIITNPTYNRLRVDFERVVGKLPHGSGFLRLGRKVEESLKGLLVPGLVFEELGFRYVGPIDGHHLSELIATLRNVRRLKGPILLHVATIKGKGYRFAEADPERFHKVEPFDIETGQPLAPGSRPHLIRRVKVEGRRFTSSASSLRSPATFTEAFSEELLRVGEANRRVVVLTAAMPEGTGVSAFAARYPERCLDVGMAEQHALGVAAGLARGGARPIVAIYATFLQRAFDQIMHEVCLQELPVILAIDRAGLVGEDGPTHHGVFDLAYLRVLPNLMVLAPKDPAELQAMLRWALTQPAPIAIRYPRGGVVWGHGREGTSTPIAAGTSECLREGTDLALVAMGSMVAPSLAVAEALARAGLDATVINARFVKPLDEAMLRAVAHQGALVTLEETPCEGGFGSAVAEALERLGVPPMPHLGIGLPDAFIEHGKRAELLTRCRLDPEQLTQRVFTWFRGLPRKVPRQARQLAVTPTLVSAKCASVAGSLSLSR